MSEPWHGLYGDLPREIVPAHPTLTAMADAALHAKADEPLAWYFDRPITGDRLRADRDALACALAALGVVKGDRVALYLQNGPAMVLALLAVWRLGAIGVTVNPMLRERELRTILEDSGATVLVALEELHDDVARHVVDATDVATVITACPLDGLDAGGEIPAPLAGVRRVRRDGTHDLADLLARYAGGTPPPADVGPDDIALLVYTSGTTGPPKGAMVLHRNAVFSSEVFRRWGGVGPDDVNLVLAPLFHITGLIGGLGVSLAAAMPLVLSYRFDAGTVLALAGRRRPTYTVAAITAFSALMEHPAFAGTDLSCLRAAYSGGAPVPPATAERWRAATGQRIHNAYGLTESTSPTHLTPLGAQGPVDPTSGALAVGIPVSGTSVLVVDDAGQPLPPGQIGEFATAGPQVVPGYWGKPEETAHAFPAGRLHTGDVGFMDERGWFFLVDRSKDVIVAAGYKVWPREVEDVLYEHPAVREAAVIGVPDDYRGETVKAFVSFRDGSSASPEELVAFCRERLAAYKVPRRVQVQDDLPKTVTGKILRRELREAQVPPEPAHG